MCGSLVRTDGRAWRAQWHIPLSLHSLLFRTQRPQMYLFAPKEGSQNNHSVLLVPTNALSEEDWIMLLGYC